jgi:transposase
MGRPRGGLTTKIRALVDAMGLPIMRKLTEGQAADGYSAADMFDTVGKGVILLADQAYDSDASRAQMDARGAWANIRAMPQHTVKPVLATSSVNIVTSLSASLINSCTSELLPRVMIKETIPILPLYNSLQYASG